METNAQCILFKEPVSISGMYILTLTLCKKRKLVICKAVLEAICGHMYHMCFYNMWCTLTSLLQHAVYIVHREYADNVHCMYDLQHMVQVIHILHVNMSVLYTYIIFLIK